MNVQRVSARTTRMHLFLIFNLETTVGAIWPWILPSSIVLTSCFISSRSFSVEIYVSQFANSDSLNACHWAWMDCTVVCVSLSAMSIYMKSSPLPLLTHVPSGNLWLLGGGQEIDKKHTLTAVSCLNVQMFHQYQLQIRSCNISYIWIHIHSTVETVILTSVLNCGLSFN